MAAWAAAVAALLVFKRSKLAELAAAGALSFRQTATPQSF
jgi:hypothetical protein